MSKTIIRDSRQVRTRKKSLVVKVAAVRESRVVLFGQKTDPEVIQSKAKAALTRNVEVLARPSFDSGIGPCGKHICSCKSFENCKNQFTGA